MTTGKTIALTRWTFAGKVLSLLFNMLSRLVIIFLPRSKCLLISWLKSPSSVILEPRKISLSLFPLFLHLFPVEWWDRIDLFTLSPDAQLQSRLSWSWRNFEWDKMNLTSVQQDTSLKKNQSTSMSISDPPQPSNHGVCRFRTFSSFLKKKTTWLKIRLHYPRTALFTTLGNVFQCYLLCVSLISSYQKISWILSEERIVKEMGINQKWENKSILDLSLTWVQEF